MLFFGTGMTVADLRQVRTVDCNSERLKMVGNISANWSVQVLRILLETPSGPAAFLSLILRRVDLTWCWWSCMGLSLLQWSK